MAARSSVLVTRPEGQAGPLCARLRELGWSPVHVPLISLEPLRPLPASQRQLVLDLDRYQHVIFISANAVRFGMEVIADYWPQLPLGIQWYAVGDSTASALAEWGIDAATPGREMTSEGLLKLPGLLEPRDERVLLIKGEGGRDVLATTLARRGARVDALRCYRRGPADLTPEKLFSTLDEHAIHVVMISSGEGLANLLALPGVAESSSLGGMAWVLPSQRVAEAALQAGLEQCVVAENASDAAMLEALEHWYATCGGRQ